jgi:hypothetical protein
MNKFTLLLSIMFLFSCSTTTNRNQKSSALDVSLTSRLEAELDIDMSKKIHGTAKQSKLFGFINIHTTSDYVDGVNYDGSGSGFSLFSGGIVEDTKSAAAYNAVVPNKADVIVAPQYIVQIHSFLGIYKEVTALVSGYAGKIKDIRHKDAQTVPQK